MSIHNLCEQIKNSYSPYVLKKALVEEINRKPGREFIKEDWKGLISFKDGFWYYMEKLEKDNKPGKFEGILNQLMEEYNQEAKLIELAEDYYDILGLTPEATNEEIKKVYRRLSIKYHPDKVAPEKRVEFQALFSKLGSAHEVLSDERKRQHYDLCLSKLNEVDERGKRMVVVENKKKFSSIENQPVTLEFVQQVVEVIKDECRSVGGMVKVIEDYLIILKEGLARAEKEGQTEECNKKTGEISMWEKILGNIKKNWEYWIMFLELSAKQKESHKKFLKMANLFLTVIQEVKVNRERKAGILAGLEANFAEIEGLLNSEPTLKIVNAHEELWGELHSDFWNFRHTLTSLCERGEEENEKYYFEELKFDIRMRREIKKFLLTSLKQLITSGEELLNQEKIEKTEVSEFLRKLDSQKKHWEAGQLDVALGRAFLRVYRDFVNNELELVEIKTLRLDIDFQPDKWKHLAWETWQSQETEINRLADNLWNFRKLVKLRKLKKYIQDYLTSSEVNLDDLRQEIKTNSYWEDLYEDYAEQVEEIIKQVQDQLRPSSPPSRTDHQASITSSQKETIINYLDEVLDKVQEKKQPGEKQREWEKFWTSQPEARKMFGDQQKLADEFQVQWVTKNLSDLKWALKEYGLTEDYRKTIAEKTSLREAEKMRAEVLRSVYNYCFHKLGNHIKTVKDSEGFENTINESGSPEFAQKNILGSFQRKILAELAAAGINYAELPSEEQNLLKKKESIEWENLADYLTTNKWNLIDNNINNINMSGTLKPPKIITLESSKAISDDHIKNFGGSVVNAFYFEKAYAIRKVINYLEDVVDTYLYSKYKYKIETLSKEEVENNGGKMSNWKETIENADQYNVDSARQEIVEIANEVMNFAYAEWKKWALSEEEIEESGLSEKQFKKIRKVIATIAFGHEEKDDTYGLLTEAIKGIKEGELDKNLSAAAWELWNELNDFSLADFDNLAQEESAVYKLFRRFEAFMEKFNHPEIGVIFLNRSLDFQEKIWKKALASHEKDRGERLENERTEEETEESTPEENWTTRAEKELVRLTNLVNCQIPDTQEQLEELSNQIVTFPNFFQGAEASIDYLIWRDNYLIEEKKNIKINLAEKLQNNFTAYCELLNEWKEIQNREYNGEEDLARIQAVFVWLGRTVSGKESSTQSFSGNELNLAARKLNHFYRDNLLKKRDSVIRKSLLYGFYDKGTWWTWKLNEFEKAGVEGTKNLGSFVGSVNFWRNFLDDTKFLKREAWQRFFYGRFGGNKGDLDNIKAVIENGWVLEDFAENKMASQAATDLRVSSFYRSTSSPSSKGKGKAEAICEWRGYFEQTIDPVLVRVADLIEAYDWKQKIPSLTKERDIQELENYLDHLPPLPNWISAKLGSDWRLRAKNLTTERLVKAAEERIQAAIDSKKSELTAKIDSEKAQEKKDSELSTEELEATLQEVTGNSEIKPTPIVITSWQGFNNPDSELRAVQQINQFLTENKEASFRSQTETEMENKKDSSGKALDPQVYSKKDGKFTQAAMVNYLFQKKTGQAHQFAAIQEQKGKQSHWDKYGSWYIGGVLLVAVAGLAAVVWDTLKTPGKKED